MARLLLLVVLVIGGWNAEAQRRPAAKKGDNNMSLADRLYFGGGGSFGSGTDAYGYRYTYISASPLMGYRITLPFSVGAGVNYTYYRFPDVKLTLNQYGISPFARYQFGKLFAYGEYSLISAPSFDKSTRKIYNRLPIGLGYTIPIGDKAALNAMALYDVLYNKQNSVFYSPWVFRVFISAGALTF